eukprot:s1993_g7.t1
MLHKHVRSQAMSAMRAAVMSTKTLAWKCWHMKTIDDSDRLHRRTRRGTTLDSLVHHLECGSRAKSEPRIHRTVKYCTTSSTAQGGGGSFKGRKPTERFAVMHGWQSEPRDGPKGG